MRPGNSPAGRIDRTCDRFEKSWRAGQTPRIEDYLEEFDEPERPALVRELVALEIELRRVNGEDLLPHDYLDRFPSLTVALPAAVTLTQAPATHLNHSKIVPVLDILPAFGPDLEIVGKIGRGGMGVVYKARQIGLDRDVAVKLMAGAYVDPAHLARFHTEARAIGRLDHPNIVQVYDVGEEQGRPYIVMEFVEGGSLGQKLKTGPLPVRRSAQLVEELALAIDAAHRRGVVHRDLKPENILLTTDGRPKLTDFGLAKLLSSAPLSKEQTGSGMIMGTPSYMAPEQARGGSRDVGPTADIYALGATLYEMLTGQPPFQAASPLETIFKVLNHGPIPPARLRPKLPRDLETICLKCLEKDPERRYSSGEALADDLHAFLGGMPIQGRRPGPRRRLVMWVRERPALATLIGAGTVGILALLVGLWFSNAVVTSGLALVGLLAGSLWSQARLRSAVRQLASQQVATERYAERLLLLGEMSRRLLGVTDLERLLYVMAETATRLADAELATIFLTDRERGEVWSKVKLDTTVDEIRVPLGVGIAGTVAMTGQVINLADAHADSRFNPEIDRKTGYQTRTLLALPITDPDGKVLGTLQILNKRSGPFDVADEEVLGALAYTAAVAVKNAL